MASEVAELVDVEGNGSGEELEIVDVEDPFSQRKQELKDLRARVLILHQNVKRSDKQQKKAIQEEIAQLKALLETKRKLLEADQKQVVALYLFPHLRAGQCGRLGHGKIEGGGASFAAARKETEGKGRESTEGRRTAQRVISDRRTDAAARKD